MTTAEIIEFAADVIEREGYDPDFYHSCDGSYCQGGAIAAVLGAEPSGPSHRCGTGITRQRYEAALAALHPDLPAMFTPTDPTFQKVRYSSREDVVRHMREVAAELTEQEQECPAAIPMMS